MAAPAEEDVLLALAVDAELEVVVALVDAVVLVALVALVEPLLLWSVVPQALSATAVIRMRLRKSERPRVTTLVFCICKYSPLR